VDSQNERAYWTDYGVTEKHRYKLRKQLRVRKFANLTEEAVFERKYGSVISILDDIVPGKIVSQDGSDYYISEGSKLRTTNLATGTKFFSILKILMQSGKIDDRTILVLDEPESHLHPAWINVLAETVVLLVKEMGTKILLTTHSPDLMMAIDAQMRKHKINDMTNFYQTEHIDDYFVEYKLVNDDLELIYEDFVKHFLEMKALRDSYIFDEGEDRPSDDN
jgi:predicted ATP-dependent endonuclease of OLD family